MQPFLFYKMRRFGLFFLISVLLYSCTESVSLEDRLAVQVETEVAQKKGPLTIIPVVYKKQYSLQKLTLKSEAQVEVINKLSLQFEEELPLGYEIHYSVNNLSLIHISEPTRPY